MGDRVLCTVRIQVPGALVELLPPPDAAAPSARWMMRLAQRLRPVRGEVNAFQCCIGGSLAEVASHFWQHQTLWMHFQPTTTDNAATTGSSVGLKDADWHVALPMSEVLEPSADLSSGRFHNMVPLQEEKEEEKGHTEGQQSQQVVVGIHLESVNDSLGWANSALLPEPPGVFALHLAAAHGCIAKVLQDAGKAVVLTLSFGGVEQPLQGSMHCTLVLVQTWSEVAEALLELNAFILAESLGAGEAGSGGNPARSPLDLSQLVAAAEANHGKPAQQRQVSAIVRGSCNLLGLQKRLTFTATVRCESCRPKHGEPPEMPQANAGHSISELDDCQVVNMPAGPRKWRVSIEIRSLKLTSCTANVIVAYAYEPLRQSRPFRNSPPTLARRGVTTQLPHTFAAYTLCAVGGELQARLEEPLHLEVWSRDVYKKDVLMGLVEASVGPLFEQPLQRSSSRQSNTNGFRVLDQICPIAGTADSPDKAIGILRLLIFLEDLGTSAAAGCQQPASCPAPNSSRPALHNPSSFTEMAQYENAGDELRPPTSTDAVSDQMRDLRAGTAYSVAYELELWKKAETEKFRLQLADREAALQEQLEDEYRQQETARAQEFRHRQSEVRDLELKVKRKLLELQQREAAIVAEDKRITGLCDDMKRKADLAIQDSGHALHYRTAELNQSLVWEQERSGRMEQQVSDAQAELSVAQCRVSELESELQMQRCKLEQEAPLEVRVRAELQKVQQELRNSETEVEALSASRDFFRSQVEGLCKRLLDMDEASVAATETWQARSFSSSVQVPPLGQGLVPNATDPPAMIVQGPAQQVLHQTTSSDAFVHLTWLQGERTEMLRSGLYSEQDPVILAIDAKIAAAASVWGVPQTCHE